MAEIKMTKEYYQRIKNETLRLRQLSNHFNAPIQRFAGENEWKILVNSSWVPLEQVLENQRKRIKLWQSLT